MKISATLLKLAVDFVSNASSEDFSYSNFVKIELNKAGDIRTKLSGNLIFAIACWYRDESLRTSWDNEANSLSMVVDIKKLATYLQFNQNDLKVTITDKRIVLKGNGQLTLSHAAPQEYLQAEFDSSYFDSPNSEDSIYRINGRELINKAFYNIKFLVDWADRTSPSPDYRNIHFYEGGASVRDFKNNILIYANNYATNSEDNTRLECDGLIDPQIFNPIIRIADLSTLEFFVSKTDEEISLSNIFSFLGINSSTGMQFWLHSRVISGSHNVAEMMSLAEQTIEGDKFIECGKEELSSLIAQSEGYINKTNKIAKLKLVDSNLIISIKNDNDEYENQLSVNTNFTSEDEVELFINAISFKKIIGSTVNPNIKIYIYYDVIKRIYSRIAIIDKGVKLDEGVVYLFPTSVLVV